MKNFFGKVLIYLASSAIGLLVASLLPGFSLSPWGFFIAVVAFTVLQAIFTPMVSAVMNRYATSFMSAVGIISTFLALLIANFLPGGLKIGTLTAWIFGTVIVWAMTAMSTLVFAKLFES